MRSVYEAHQDYKEEGFRHRRFKHRDVVRLLKDVPFHKEVIGTSYEGRSITQVTVGKGSRKILLWSQMHGDEATATMALFDIFHFIRQKDDEFAAFRDEILQKCTLYFVPMLNPDGAERFQRRTAQEIDMNRDALALQCPESVVLKGLVEKLKPEFSFNLHDQSNHYAVGETGVQTTVAFLATAYNAERSWNEGRIKSAQVIAAMNAALQKEIPGRVAKFSDEFEPRAFGDNIQRWGSSLVLVESGAYQGDVEKQYVRKLNFGAILTGLHSIATGEYGAYSVQDYEAIPENNRVLLDLKIKNLAVGERKYQVEVGVIRSEKNRAGAKDFVYESVIEELGDLSVFHGIEEWDAKGGVFRSVLDFPEWIAQYKIKRPMKHLQLGETATFVVDHGDTQTLILNGKIV